MEGFASTCVLPRVTAETLKSCDLFQPSSIEPSSIEPAPEPTAEQIESEPTIEFKVGAVYGAYNRPDQSALIDGKIVQTGEELESGVTVVSVSPEGVQVAP